MGQRLRQGAAEWLIASCGIWQLGLGLYFILFRPALLPEDLRYLGADLQTLNALVPRLENWLSKVFAVLAGFMAGAGVLTAYVGWVVMPSRPRWTTLVLVLVGALTLGLMSVVNFALHSEYRWLLALPPAIWAGAIVLYVRARPSSPQRLT